MRVNNFNGKPCRVCELHIYIRLESHIFSIAKSEVPTDFQRCLFCYGFAVESLAWRKHSGNRLFCRSVEYGFATPVHAFMFAFMWVFGFVSRLPLATKMPRIDWSLLDLTRHLTCRIVTTKISYRHPFSLAFFGMNCLFSSRNYRFRPLSFHRFSRIPFF
jgi:hypothetical protein